MALALTLILLALAFTFLDQLYNSTDLAGTMGDVNENLRAAVNVIARDLSTCGWEIPLGGIPIPNGGTATAIVMPGPPPSTVIPATSTSTTPNNTANNFPANGGYMAVLTPGPGYGQRSVTGGSTAAFTWSNSVTVGATGAAIPTDQITMITVNPLITPLATSGTPTITATAATVTTTTSPSQFSNGQIVWLYNGNGSCLLTVTATTATTITFTKGSAYDSLGLNQFTGPTTGTITQLETVGPPVAWPSITLYPINMITYYVDNSSPQQRLMRLVGSGCASCTAAQPVALGIVVLQFSYSFSPLATPTDPIRGPFTNPNQIRKVNVWVIAKADHPNRKSRLYYTNSIATSVAIQNLAYYNQY